VTSVSRASNVNEAKELLDRHGICVMEIVLDAEGLERVRCALRQGIAKDEGAGVQVRGFPFDPDTHNIRLFDLIGKDPVFVELVEHPNCGGTSAPCDRFAFPAIQFQPQRDRARLRLDDHAR
jgi:hypothetical protein